MKRFIVAAVLIFALRLALLLWAGAREFFDVDSKF